MGSDVYVAGSEYNGSVNVAKYWKNGQAIALTDGTNDAYANSIVVVGSDVYVAGWNETGLLCSQILEKRAGYSTHRWNKRCLMQIPLPLWAAMYMWQGLNTTVRISVAKYWKNGQAIALTDGTKDAYANSIAVVGSDVYVAGYENNGSVYAAKYWKNGQASSTHRWYKGCISISTK